MTTIGVACPHCSAANKPGDAFCVSCGKALPVPTSGPRMVDGNQLPVSSAGAKLVGDDLNKQMKKASNTLLGVAIAQLVLGGLVSMLILSTAPGGAVDPMVKVRVYGTVIGISAIFGGLYVWARKAPLPASIVGLVVYSTLVIINVVSNMAALAEGHGTGIGGLGIGWLDIIIIAFLAQGINAALKYRKLLASQAMA